MPKYYWIVNNDYYGNIELYIILKGRGLMAYSYNKLWKLLIDKGINKTELRSLAGLSTNVIAKLGKNQPVSMESLTKICAALECDIGDILEFQVGRDKQV
jgi:DNA (cytosine-5)-methyltransferase 1